VRTGAERALWLAEPFRALPAASLRDAVLCVGMLTLECEKAEGGEGEGEEGGEGEGEEGGEVMGDDATPGGGQAAEAEAEAEAEATVVSRIEALAVPSRRTSMSLEELVSRGGTVLASGGEDDDDEW
jgi:hypothetical protein